MQWQALNDRVTVKVDIATETLGGIIVADAAQDAMVVREGTILSVGPTANEHNAGLLTIGARVRFNKYSGVKIEEQDDTLLAIAAADLLVVGLAATATAN